MSDWVLKPLGDLITLQRGHDLPSQKRVDGVVPIMGSSGITGFHNEAKASGPGVVVGRSGNSMGEVSFSHDDFWPLNTCLYITDFKGNDERYIYYLLKIIDFDQFNSGSAQKSLNRNAVYPYEVKTTTCKAKQKRIAKVLADLEEKIELDRQTNQTLEQIAQAIFKSWFVDFEPTHAKIQAKKRWQALNDTTEPSSPTCYSEELDTPNPAQQQQPNLTLDQAMTQAAMAAISGKSIEAVAQLSPEQQQQLKTIADLFPDALVESELGEIPEGWQVKLSGDVMDVRDGTHDSPKKSDVGFPLVTSKHMTSGVLKLEDAYLISEEDYERVNKRSQVNQGDILLTMIGTVGIPYLVSQSKVNFAIKNVGLFRTSDVRELKNYFYLLLRTPQMKVYLDARMAGTTQKYLSLKTLRSIELVMPITEILGEFNVLVNALMEKIFEAISENKELENVRDAVLPKLLSGDLKFNESVA